MQADADGVDIDAFLDSLEERLVGSIWDFIINPIPDV